MATLGNSTITTLSLLNALGVADGGTGAKTFTSGAALIGNGTGAFATRSITNNTSATAVTASTNLITANTLYYHKGNSNIVTVGTITSGTWQGTAIANAYLANSKVTVAGKDISLGGSLSAADLKTALGLNNVSNTAASGYLTALSSNTTNAVSITVGGTTKNIAASTMKTSLGLGSLAYLSSISASSITQGYLNTHPENSPIIVPFINNDLAFLNKKGGSYKVYKTTSTDYTASSLSEAQISISGGDNMFDGSPSYAMISTTGEYVAVIDMTLHKTFAYSNVFYIDFGSTSWRAKNISVYVMNADTETKYTKYLSVENNAKGNVYGSVSHTSTNSSGTTVYGFNRLRVVLSGFNGGSSSSGKRIAQVGLLNYGSAGVTETYISRGGCDGIYGSLVPHTTNSFNLGSSSKKWANVYATTFNGNATSATKATQDGDGNVITTTYAKIADVSGLDIFAGMTLKTGVSTKTHSGWDNTANQDKIIPTMNFIAYWNGAYNASNGSNLTYCVKGAFGDAAIKAVTTSVTSGSTSLVTSGGVYTALASYLPLTGGTLAGTSQNTPLTIKGTASGNDAWIAFHNNSGFLASLGFSNDKKLKIYTNNTSYNVWTAANQGSGSGLDADKLDGYHASSFSLAHDHNYLPLAGGTMTGAITMNTGTGIAMKYTSNGNDVWMYPNGAQTYGIRYFEGNPDKMAFSATGNNDTVAGADLCINGAGDGTVTIRGKKIWHEGNATLLASNSVAFSSGAKDNLSHDANAITSNGVWYYTSNGPSKTLGATTDDGALYSQAYNASWVAQIAQDYRDGDLFTRGRNNGTWSAWKRVAYVDDIPDVSGFVTTSGNNTFTGKNVFTATASFNTPETQKFVVGDSSSAFVFGSDGLQCFSGTSSTAAKVMYINYYGGAVYIGKQNGTQEIGLRGNVTVNGSAVALADGSNASGTWGIGISGNAGSADNSYYLFTQQQNNTSFYPNYKAYIKWIANDIASIKFTDGTYKFKADLAGSADDSAKLNGQAASYYATAASLASYLALDGSSTMTGAIKIAETKGILLRHTNTSYTAGIGYDTQGNECIAMWAKNSVTRLRWHAGTDMSGTTYQQMMSITPDFEISKADGTAKGYIGGSAIITAANIDSYIPDGSGNTVDLTNYVVKNGTSVQCIGGGLVVGATSTSGVSAAAAGRIMITGHTNPLIGLIATGSSTPFYFQVSNDIVYLGPTSSVALSLDGSGNTTVRGTLTASKDVTTSGKYIGSLNNSLTVFGKAYNNSAAVTVADTDLVSSVTEGTSTCTDGTEFLTSWASDNGFNDTSGKNKIYRRKMSKVYDYIKGKLDSVYLGKNANAVNGTFYGVCDTAAGTFAKTVEIDGFPSTLTAGTRVTIKFTYASANTDASNPMTLNVSGTGAYTIYRYGTTLADNGTTTSGWIAGAVQTFTFDGNGWVREYWSNTTYTNVSLGQGYATCSTAATTTAKTASLSSYALTTGGIVSVKFTYDVPAGATLNINSKGAKAIYYRGSAITAGVIKAGDTATFIYSTNYHLISVDKSINTAMHINSSGNVTIGDSDLAGSDYKLVVNGLSRFKNNVESEGNIIGAGAVQAKTSAHGFVSLQVGSTGNKGLLDSRTSWIIYTNGTNTLLPQGNVGIGTTSPTYKLQVNGTARISGAVTMSSSLTVDGNITANGVNVQTEIIYQTAPSVTIQPNVYNKWNGTCTSLTLQFATPVNVSIINNYMFEFTAASTGCTVSLPSTVKWQNGAAPTIAPGCTYQVSITDSGDGTHLAVCSMFK
jgi:hypothetical protein